jgi:hypothetical protein
MSGQRSVRLERRPAGATRVAEIAGHMSRKGGRASTPLCGFGGEREIRLDSNTVHPNLEASKKKDSARKISVCSDKNAASEMVFWVKI